MGKAHGGLPQSSRGYDGSKDCAPAVVAMRARAAGAGGNLSDAAPLCKAVTKRSIP
jgi:hypothetical protein